MNAVASEKTAFLLYVAGPSARTSFAISNIRNICEEYLKDCYDLQVIDIYQQPELAEAANIIAAPTLVRKLPPPSRRVVGDLSDRDRVISVMDVAR